jgi:hypothetical protein
MMSKTKGNKKECAGSGSVQSCREGRKNFQGITTEAMLLFVVVAG